MTVGRRCCEASEAAGESIAATATYARNWLVVEVPGTWPRDVSDGAGLPTAAREAVQAWLRRMPTSRLLFARQPGRTRAGRVLVFVVQADDDGAEVRRFELSRARRAGSGRPRRRGRADERVARSGVRSRRARPVLCPARDGRIRRARAGRRRGRPLDLLTSGRAPLRRERRRPAAGSPARARERRRGRARGRRGAHGRLPSSGYRGRTTYPPEAQAAEIAIRAASGLDGIADLRLTGIEGRRVSFRDSDGHEHVAVVETARGPAVPASCGAEPEPHAVLTARVL